MRREEAHAMQEEKAGISEMALVKVSAEGSEKATRGGGECESIKIPQRNLAYVPKSVQCPSLLTRPRPHSYSKVIGPQNRVRNRSGNTN
jgi:hypothetical protein